MDSVKNLYSAELPTWKFVANQALISATAALVISVAIGVFSLHAAVAFAVPFTLTAAVAISAATLVYKDDDNRRYSLVHLAMSPASALIHLGSALLLGSFVPLVSGTLLALYFVAAHYIDRDKVES